MSFATNDHDRILVPAALHNKTAVQVCPLDSTIKILKNEFKTIMGNPLDIASFQIDERYICVWYFLLNGTCDTPYEGGLYLGTFLFPPDFPYGPPEIQMISPSGRFLTRRPICLTMSSFHKESWNPSWTIEKLTIGLLSFMNSTEYGSGCLETTSLSQKRQIASNSKKWLVYNCDIFEKIFPQEHQILKSCFEVDGFDLADSILNQPIQTQARGDETRERLIEAIEQKELILKDISCNRYSLREWFNLNREEEILVGKGKTGRGVTSSSNRRYDWYLENEEESISSEIESNNSLY